MEHASTHTYHSMDETSAAVLLRIPRNGYVPLVALLFRRFYGNLHVTGILIPDAG